MYQPTAIRGFTIVELLVVISIMGILALGGGAAYNEVQKAARDETRVTELDQVALALAAYKAEFGHYPRAEDGYGTFAGNFCGTAEVIVHDTSVTACNGFVTDSDTVNTILENYMGTRPQDPRHSDAGAANGNWGNNYFYYYHPEQACDGDYDIVMVAAQRMETDKYTNVGEVRDNCPNLPDAPDRGITDQSYIKIIEYFPT